MATRTFLSFPSRMRGGDPFMEFRREMDRLFESMMPAMSYGGLAEPRLDAYASGDDFCVSAELPGVRAADVEVTLDGDVLTIVGEKKSSPDHQDGDTHIAERSYGRFMRKVQLPFTPDPDQIGAQMDDGVLTVRLRSRTGQQGARRIEVRDAGEPARVGNASAQPAAGEGSQLGMQEAAAQGRVPNP